MWMDGVRTKPAVDDDIFSCDLCYNQRQCGCGVVCKIQHFTADFMVTLSRARPRLSATSSHSLCACRTIRRKQQVFPSVPLPHAFVHFPAYSSFILFRLLIIFRLVSYSG